MDQSVSTPEPPDPLLAVRVAGYRLHAELGRGGMAVVYRALQESTGRDVALKVLARGGPDHDEAVERFVREAMHAASLRHPGIVPIHDAGVFDDVCYLSMELVEGPALDLLLDAVRDRSPESLKESFYVETGLNQVWPDSVAESTELPYNKSCASWIALVADAIQAAHDAGVIHRDLKPANIMVRGDGQPVVVDFGLSRAAGDPSLTRSGETVGTPAYMAPEQATGSPDHDGRVDVWALGAILYEMLTLRPPIPGSDAAEVMRRVVHEGPMPIGVVRSDLPFGLVAVIDCALHDDPEQRYSDPASLAADLRRFVAGERTRAEVIRSSAKARFLAARDGLAVVSARHPWAWLACTGSVCVASVALLLSGGVPFGDPSTVAHDDHSLIPATEVHGPVAMTPRRAESQGNVAGATRAGSVRWNFRDPGTASSATFEVLRADESGRSEHFVSVPLSGGSVVEGLPPGRHVFRVHVPELAAVPLAEAAVVSTGRRWIRVVDVPSEGVVEVQVPRIGEKDAWEDGLGAHGFRASPPVFAMDDARFGFDLEPVEFSVQRFRALADNVLDPEIREDLLPASQRSPGQNSLGATDGLGGSATSTVPVTGLSYRRARLLAALAGGHLPDAREWEAGARGGLPPWRFPWGSADGTNGSASFGERLACDPRGLNGPVPVSALPESASPLGVMHLVGNVAEWLGGAGQPVLAGGSIATPPSQVSMFMRERGPGHELWGGAVPSYAGLRLARFVAFPEPPSDQLRRLLEADHVAWHLDGFGNIRCQWFNAETNSASSELGSFARMHQRGDVVSLTLPELRAVGSVPGNSPTVLHLPVGVVVVDSSPEPDFLHPTGAGTLSVWSDHVAVTGACVQVRADRLLTDRWVSMRRVRPVLDGFFASLTADASHRAERYLHPEHVVDLESLKRLKVLDLRLQDVVSVGSEVVATILGTRVMIDRAGVERTVSRWPCVVRLQAMGAPRPLIPRIVSIEPGRWLGEDGISVLDPNLIRGWLVSRQAQAFVPLQLAITDPKQPDQLVRVTGVRRNQLPVHLAAASGAQGVEGALEELLSAGDVSDAAGEVWPGPKLATVAMPKMSSTRMHPTARHFMFSNGGGFAREEWVQVDLPEWHLLVRMIGKGSTRIEADQNHQQGRNFFLEVAAALRDPASTADRAQSGRSESSLAKNATPAIPEARQIHETGPLDGR